METGPNPYGCPWESVICAAIGFLAVLLFVWRSCQSVRSRRYLRRERQLALKLAGLNEDKCELLEKVRLVQKEYEGLESSLKDAIFEKESIDAPNLGAICEELDRSKSKLGDEILFLGKELQEEKTKHSQQVEWMADISERIKSLEDESKALKSQIAEAKTTWSIFHRNEEGSGGAIRKVLDETSQLQESQKQLSQEAEACKEKANDLNKHKITLEDSEVHAEQVLRGKENHIKSLNEHLLKMKDWAPVLVQDPTDDGTLELEIKGESDIGADFDDQPKGVLKKRVYVAKFNGSIETLPGERNHTFTLVSEVDQRKEDLVEHITNLKTEQASLQAENTQFESDNQNLEPKLKAMTELHQENVMNLQRKLIVVENCQVEQEEKLRKVEEKISHTTALLDTYRKRAKDLEEELERTIHFWQGHLIYYEKKAHDNELAAQSAERYLSDLRKQNAHKRRQVREIEFKFQHLEKDPYPLDGSNTASGREHSPNGPSPLGQPSSDENQATGSGSVFPPFPPIRGPWFPVDPRSQFMRRGPFFPPPPPGNMYGAPREYFPPGPPPPPWPVGNGDSPRGFPQYLSPRAGFFPPAPYPESKSEFPAGFIPPSSEPATDHPEPQQEN